MTAKRILTLTLALLLTLSFAACDTADQNQVPEVSPRKGRLQAP